MLSLNPLKWFKRAPEPVPAEVLPPPVEARDPLADYREAKGSELRKEIAALRLLEAASSTDNLRSKYRAKREAYEALLAGL